ncbi:hypothetical protein HII31_12745 [Pseudocercospora fuligena]|uniref:Uncharacterized protein n=1 Tax=Pseudocercospora fuligena TaxID=685502 RepID=A0A8H6R8Q5_9PEZI|nr:hypothetical protein HII31_12745 [Pseudocercospora fuligena]
MSSLSPTNPNHQLKLYGCNCAICRSLHGARASLAAIPIHQMNTSHVDSDAAGLVLEAERLLSAAQSILLQYHITQQNRLPAIEQRPNGMSPPQTANGTPQPVADDTSPAKSDSTVHPSQTATSWRSSSTSPMKSEKPENSQETIIARLSELGLLRDQAGNSQPSTPTTVVHQDGKLVQKSKFLVCDHCRSHGIRCNEASVCKECILREVPCTHRMCELSPNSKEDCPRQVCFYVHEDWMPDVYGNHNPGDDNWLILPGRIREHLTAGQLGKLPQKDGEEVLRCYQGVSFRQTQAKQALTHLVETGQATWETANMACKCREIEDEEQRAHAIETKLRRMAVSPGAAAGAA